MKKSTPTSSDATSTNDVNFKTNDIIFSRPINDDDNDNNDGGASFETSEFEFKPVLNPPPEFFELRPVTNNLLQKFAKIEPDPETATVSSTTVFLPDVTSSPPAEYAEEDYNNYTEAPTSAGSYEESESSEQSEQPSDNYYQDYPQQQQQQHSSVDPRFRRKTRKPVNTGIFTAFSRVTDVLDNLFSNGFDFFVSSLLGGSALYSLPWV